MFWNVTHPKARKQRRCEMCGRIIEPGETYLRGVGMDDHVWHWNECAHCEAMRRIYDLDDYGEYSVDDFTEWEPSNARELRVKAGFRMKWRTRLGTLLPVPTPVSQVGT